MKKELKQEIVKDVKKGIEESTVSILMDYRGMSVKSITELKKRLRKQNAEFRVVKNTLFELAMDGKEFETLKAHLVGPTAILLGYEDPVGPVKVLAKFISDNEKPKIKAGVFEGKLATVEELTAISKLPGREELLAKVVGGIKSPINGFVWVLKGTMNKLVYALQALKDKKSQEKGGE